MNSSDPTKLEDGDSESENEEWILVTDEEDLSSSFVDLQDGQENLDEPKENMQTEAQMPQSDPTNNDPTDNKTLDIVQAQAISIEPPKQEQELQVESVQESTKIKTSYAEVVRKANKSKTNWMTRNGKTRAKRKKGRSRPQVTHEEKKTERRGSSSCGHVQDSFPNSSPCNSLSSSSSLSTTSSLSSSSSNSADTSSDTSSIALPYLPSPPQMYTDVIPEKISKNIDPLHESPPILSSQPSTPPQTSQESNDQPEETTNHDRPNKSKKKKKHKKKQQSSESNSNNNDTFCNATPEKDGKEDLLSHRKKGALRSSIHTEAQSVKEVFQKPTRGLERTVACIIGLAVFFGCVRLALGDSTEVVRAAQQDTLSLVY